MKLLVVLTGGTIGSFAKDSVISVSETSPYLLLQLYEQTYGSDVSFEVIQPLNILSENLSQKHWTTLFQTLKKIDFNTYDGIIITHGSDTLSYTSSLFSMLFSNCPIPMVFIAANYNLNDDRSNGLINFRSAVNFICSQKYTGVFTIYQNQQKDNTIYYPTRLLPSDPYEDQFQCFGSIPFGHIEEDGIYQSAKEADIQPLAKNFDFMTMDSFFANILKLVPYPGFSYESVDLHKKPHAILHQLYHSGTCCTDSSENNLDFIAFADKCHEQNIPLYLCSMKHPSGNYYESTHLLLSHHVIPLYNISYVSAYTKLILAYSQTMYDPKQIMQTNLYHELLNEPDL